jgi:hypothetical protein
LHDKVAYKATHLRSSHDIVGGAYFVPTDDDGAARCLLASKALATDKGWSGYATVCKNDSLGLPGLAGKFDIVHGADFNSGLELRKAVD